MENKANVKNLAYVGRQPKTERDSNSWYTPMQYINMVRKVMETIDLDPFSSELANTHIKANRIFTETNSALGKKEWKDGIGQINVWMNPPYGKGLIQKAVEEFLKHWCNGEIRQAILLVNNATETKWMQSLYAEADAICHVNGRIAFVSPDGKAVSGNTRGQLFLYFGTRIGRFNKIFKTIGKVAQWIR